MHSTGYNETLPHSGKNVMSVRPKIERLLYSPFVYPTPTKIVSAKQQISQIAGLGFFCCFVVMLTCLMKSAAKK